MKVEHFFMAIEIANTGSFSQAARNLYISQPNLSHAMKQLEQELGFPLFTRTPSGIIPTPEGNAIIDQFRTMRWEYDQISEAVKNRVYTSRLSLRIATLQGSWTTAVFSDLVKQYEDTPISFSFLNYSYLDDLLPMVETCQVDCAIIGTASTALKSVLRKLYDRAIEYIPIGEAPVCGVVGEKNPLYRATGPISLKELYPYNIVQYGNAAEDPSHCLPHITGLSLHTLGEVKVNTSNLFYSIISNTTAVGLIVSRASSVSGACNHHNTRLLALTDCDITGQFGLIKLQRMPMTELENRLVESLKESFLRSID